MDNRLTIIFADDDADDRMLFEDAMLASRKYVNEVRFSSDGLELLQRLRFEGKFEADRQSRQPDLVLLDINMPSMDGFEVLEEMKSDERLNSIPVIMLSGSRRAAEVTRCYKLGASGFLVKPDTQEQLSAAFLQLTSYWALLMESP
ncbi:MAG: response regulator [Cohaesibacteraceae bacterium]|nr:response regulator [Cohaesibacteraceae bacterium]